MPKSCPCTKIDGFWKDKPNHLVHSVSNLSESFSCSKTIVKDSYSLYFIALFFPTLILDSLISKKFMSVCVCVYFGCMWMLSWMRLKTQVLCQSCDELFDWWLFQVDDGGLECQCKGIQASAEWEETLNVTSEHPVIIYCLRTSWWSCG